MESVDETGFVSARQPARRGSQGRQKREKGGRRNRIDVKVSDAEKAKLEERAAALGLSVPRLMVESALTVGGGSGPTVAERHAWYRSLTGVRRLIAAIGNNLNQLTKAANSTGQLEPETGATLDAVMRTVRRLNEVLDEMPTPPERSGNSGRGKKGAAS